MSRASKRRRAALRCSNPMKLWGAIGTDGGDCWIIAPSEEAARRVALQWLENDELHVLREVSREKALGLLIEDDELHNLWQYFRAALKRGVTTPQVLSWTED